MTPFGLPELQSLFDVVILVIQTGVILTIIIYSVQK